jgi:hypothetical protein
MKGSGVRVPASAFETRCLRQVSRKHDGLPVRDLGAATHPAGLWRRDARCRRGRGEDGRAIGQRVTSERWAGDESNAMTATRDRAVRQPRLPRLAGARGDRARAAAAGRRMTGVRGQRRGHSPS